MNIDVPVRDLGKVDSRELQQTVLSLEETAWSDQRYRQNTYEVHRQTESIVMVFTDGSGWPSIEVHKEAGWGWLVDSAAPLMNSIIEEHLEPGGVIIRAMAARMAPGAVIRPHRDSHPSFHASHRIHVPLATNARVRFTIDGRPFRFEVGHAYEINNQLTHSVMNKGDGDRVHFIFDYLPPGARADSKTGAG
jgi:hypothetical protein